MSDVQKELDDLIELLGANIPANPESKQNKKLANDLEVDLKKYFKKLEDAMPIERLEQIYLKYVEPE